MVELLNCNIVVYVMWFFIWDIVMSYLIGVVLMTDWILIGGAIKFFYLFFTFDSDDWY